MLKARFSSTFIRICRKLCHSDNRTLSQYRHWYLLAFDSEVSARKLKDELLCPLDPSLWRTELFFFHYHPCLLSSHHSQISLNKLTATTVHNLAKFHNHWMVHFAIKYITVIRKSVFLYIDIFFIYCCSSLLLADNHRGILISVAVNKATAPFFHSSLTSLHNLPLHVASRRFVISI